MEVKISHLVYYPGKAWRGIEEESLLFTPNGIVGREGVRDREFVTVDATVDKDGIHKFISQRDKAKKDDPPQSLAILANIIPKVEPGRLALTFAGNNPIDIPLDRNQGVARTIRIHQSVTPGAIDQGDEVAEWLSDHLRKDVRLVKTVPESFNRPMSTSYFDNNLCLGGQDGYPMNWLDELDVEHFNDCAKSYYGRANIRSVSWRAFRPNMVTRGFPKEVFYQINTARAGDGKIINPKPNPRCEVPKVIQLKGLLGEVDVLKVLVASDYNWKNNEGKIQPVFAYNSVALGTFNLAVGMPVCPTSLWLPRVIVGSKEEAQSALPATKAA